MKAFIYNDINPKLLKAITAVFSENNIDYELLEKADIQQFYTSGDFLAMGNANFLNGFRNTEILDDSQPKILHIVENNERFCSKNFKMSAVFQRCQPKKRELTQVVTNLTTKMKPCVIRMPARYRLLDDQEQSLIDFARSRGLDLTVHRNLRGWHWGDALADFDNVTMSPEGEYLLEFPARVRGNVETAIREIIDYATGHRNVHQCV